MLNRPGKPEGMHYLSHQSVEAAHRIVVDMTVTPGNANDSEPYLERIEYMRNHLGLDIKKTGADSSYGSGLICWTLEDMGIELYTPKARGGVNYKVAFTRKDFIYQQDNDCFICPSGKKLTLRSLEREHYNICRTCRAGRKDCGACPKLGQCVSDSHRSRSLRVNIFESAVKKLRERDGTPLHRHILMHLVRRQLCRPKGRHNWALQGRENIKCAHTRIACSVQSRKARGTEVVPFIALPPFPGLS